MSEPTPQVLVAPQAVKDLVAKFSEHQETYRRPGYNESQLRADFLDPLFIALGWDVYNANGDHEAYRDVILEQALKVEKSVRAPDYCFRIGGTPKFFVEAKKPAVDIKSDISPAFQLRRYAWTAKLPLSILTDFEEIAVYDCRIKPDKDDKASTARVMYFKYTELVDRWDEFAGIFSRDAIRKGSFDKYAESNKKKRGTAEVDAAFLEEIESWRESLAKNISLRNDVTDRELNYAVQLIIDRIIFLRMCEGRGIEPYSKLQSIANGPGVYPRLVELFQRADEKYNSGLFHFSKEKGREEPDRFTTQLTIDDKVLKDIFKRLYYPESPYEFAAMPAEILGQVYEQFLGKIIVRTSRARVRIEEKPEVKKAGGVYYTPSYIVDYIVENTVGKLLMGKTPQEAGGLTKTFLPAKNGRPITVLDPACGSGSFLIVAYQYLLDWYLEQYISKDIDTANPDPHSKGKSPRIYQSPSGDWRLTGAERKRILLAHIYGVDIDYQACEVTKLSLLLKVLEGETEETLQRQAKLFHKDRALPDLANNIKCGNSLIASDFYDQYQIDLFDEDQRLRINVFDWASRFSDVFSLDTPGFDAVIGNPPYGAAISTEEAGYLRGKYQSPANSLDTFLLFTEKTNQLLKTSGTFGLIIPSGWVATPSARPLRDLFLSYFRPLSFVSLPFGVFKNAYIDTVIVVAEKQRHENSANDDTVALVVFPQRYGAIGADDFAVHEKHGNYRDWQRGPDREFLITCSTEEASIIQKIRDAATTLESYVLVKRGIETFGPTPNKNGLTNPKLAFTGVLQRYSIVHGDSAYISYDSELQEQKPWEYFSEPRILVRQVLSRRLRIQAAFANESFLTNQSVQSLLSRPTFDANQLLPSLVAIINSKLMSWFFQNSNSVARRDDFPKIIIKQTRELPIPSLDSTPEIQAKLNLLANQMLLLKQRQCASRTERERSSLGEQVEIIDRQIDGLVYGLYGLSGQESAVIEAATRDD